MAFLRVVIAGVLLGFATATPDGAPLAACLDLTPQHFFDSIVGDAPYELLVERHEDHFDVTIVKTGSADFRGFVVQGRDGSGLPVGRFVVFDSQCKTINCPGGDSLDNTVTHSFNNDKTSIEFTYYQPAGSDGSGITLQASVVRTFFESYIGVRSQDLGGY